MDENKIPDAGMGTPTLPNMSAKVYPTKDPKQEKGSILAFANVDLGGCFAVNGIKIVEGKEGPFVSMPSQKGRDGKFHDICFPTTAEMREAINAVVMDAYQGVLEQQAALATQAVQRLAERSAKPSLRGALKDAAKESAARPAPAPARTADHGAR